MGYNSTIIVLNDGLGNIARDEEFGKNISDAIGSLGHGNPDGITVPSGNHCNPATVIETHHADETVVVAVGQNCATVLANLYGTPHHKDEHKLGIIKEMAKRLGYRLVKK